MEHVVLNSIRFGQGGEHISSFVQLRASVPAHWSQPLTAKPPITFELYDPYSRTSGNYVFNGSKLFFVHDNCIPVLFEGEIT